MRQKSGPSTSASERIVKDIRRATRKQHAAEDKIRIVLDGLRGESSIAELCRVGIAQSLYYSWSKELLEAGKRVARLMRIAGMAGVSQRRSAPAPAAGVAQDDGERSTAAIAPNVVDRQFTTDQQNRKWIADFTSI